MNASTKGSVRLGRFAVEYRPTCSSGTARPAGNNQRSTQSAQGTAIRETMMNATIKPLGLAAASAWLPHRPWRRLKSVDQPSHDFSGPRPSSASRPG